MLRPPGEFATFGGAVGGGTALTSVTTDATGTTAITLATTFAAFSLGAHRASRAFFPGATSDQRAHRAGYAQRRVLQDQHAAYGFLRADDGAGLHHQRADRVVLPEGRHDARARLARQSVDSRITGRILLVVAASMVLVVRTLLDVPIAGSLPLFLGGNLAGGKWVKELERKWEKQFGVKHAIACNSGPWPH